MNVLYMVIIEVVGLCMEYENVTLRFCGLHCLSCDYVRNCKAYANVLGIQRILFLCNVYPKTFFFSLISMYRVTLETHTGRHV
jgi:hypothetical protein